MPNLLIRLCLLVWIPLQFGVIAGAHAAMPEAGVCREIPAGRDSGDKRVALIVGNAAYRHGLPALANPANDAAAVSLQPGDGQSISLAVRLRPNARLAPSVKP